jgi:cytochrome b561
MQAPAGYSRLQIALHWAVAILIAAQFLFHDGIAAAWRALVRGAEATFGATAALHVWGGLLIGALVLWRLALRASRGAPAAPAGEPAALRRTAAFVHAALYALILAIAGTGAAAWFGAVRGATELHEALTAALLAVTGLHVAAALLHGAILRTGVLARMIRPAA